MVINGTVKSKKVSTCFRCVGEDCIKLMIARFDETGESRKRGQVGLSDGGLSQGRPAFL